MRTELQIPSDLKFLTVVEAWLLDCLQAELGDLVDWDKQSSRLRLALVEAYSNVVRHPHKEKPEVPILLRLEVKDDIFSLEIWDSGNGFDLSTYSPPDPEAQQEGGYGWLIMKRLMDRVEYQLQVNGKNCLKLETRLPKKTD